MAKELSWFLKIILGKERLAVIRSFDEHQEKVRGPLSPHCLDIIPLKELLCLDPEWLKYRLEEWLCNNHYR